LSARLRDADNMPAAETERREGDMHWRKSTWALIAWTALMALWLPVSVSETKRANGYAELAVLAVLSIWFVVALPLGAYWYTRRNTGNGEVSPLDPMDHWPPPPR
jgi:hypothetical protein